MHEQPDGERRQRGDVQLCARRASQLDAGTYSSVVATFAPGWPLVVEPGLHLHDLDLDAGPELHREPGLGARPPRRSTRCTSPITFGSETTETFTGTVNGQSGDGNPEGTVTVYYGTPTATQLCTSNLTASGANAATFSCALTASQLTVGTYASVDAVFAPAGTSSTNTNFTYTGSTSSPAQSFSVNPASENTTTSLSALTSPVTYGNETTETFTGTVSGQSGDGQPRGHRQRRPTGPRRPPSCARAT